MATLWGFLATRRPNHVPVRQTRPTSPSLEQIKRTRYVSFQQQLKHSDNYCCKCGTSFRDVYSWFPTEVGASSYLEKQCHKSRPLGRLICRNAFCSHVACRDCNFISPWMLHEVEGTVMERIPTDPKEASIVGFVCCSPGCGWSQTILPDPDRILESPTSKAKARGCLGVARGKLLPNSPQAMAEKAKDKPKQATAIDFSQYQCKAEPVTPGVRCSHACCDKCLKFELVAKDPERLQKEQEERQRTTAALRCEQEAILAEAAQNVTTLANMLCGNGIQHQKCSHLQGLAAIRMQCVVPDCQEMRWSPVFGLTKTPSNNTSETGLGAAKQCIGNNEQVISPPRRVHFGKRPGPAATASSDENSSSVTDSTDVHIAPPPGAAVKGKSVRNPTNPFPNFSLPLQRRDSMQKLPNRDQLKQSEQALRPLILVQQQPPHDTSYSRSLPADREARSSGLRPLKLTLKLVNQSPQSCFSQELESPYLSRLPPKFIRQAAPVFSGH